MITALLFQQRPDFSCKTKGEQHLLNPTVSEVRMGVVLLVRVVQDKESSSSDPASSMCQHGEKKIHPRTVRIIP